MGEWLVNKIKYFFWSMVASGALMVGSAFSPKFHDQFMSSLQKAQQVAKKHAPKSIADQIPDVNLPSQKPQTTEQAGVQRVTANSNEYIYNGRHYVLIEGKYYEAREDNTYMVNGRKVFYVSNREPEKPNPKQEDSASSSSTSDISIPTTPSEMMKTLRDAQEKMAERNRALNELEKSQ